MEKNLKEKLLPFILTIIVIVLDQITKALVVSFIPPYKIGAQFLGDFLRLIHVYNPGVAFSIGASWPDLLRRIAFSIMPLIFFAIVIVVYMKSNDFTKLQRWAIAGIVGGGIGNLIDRIFRPEGVVDFIDVKFYGLFGMERWPTFNVADSAVVVCGILLIVSFITMIIKDIKSKKEESKEV
ncbi:MAG: signal peptidase II [Treponema sp.]|nr:signal peptidase II [Treponema sp.]